jgi:hypothetical protein
VVARQAIGPRRPEALHELGAGLDVGEQEGDPGAGLREIHAMTRIATTPRSAEIRRLPMLDFVSESHCAGRGLPAPRCIGPESVLPRRELSRAW